MYTITKDFHFSASHRLSGLPNGHKCANIHGHNYVVRVVLEGDAVDERGFVVDYGDLAPIKEFIDVNLDHAHLCEDVPEAVLMYEFMFDKFGIDQRNHVIGAQTSAENIARYLWERFSPMFPALREVHVSETPKTWAVYRGR